MSKKRTLPRGYIDSRLVEGMIERAVSSALERVYNPPAGAIIKPIPQSMLNQMQAAQAPQKETQSLLAPGSPIAPVSGIIPKQGPRIYSYQVGYNIGQLPRSTEANSFQMLRDFAKLYDAIGLCKRTWFDLCSKPELVIKPKPELVKDGDDGSQWQPYINNYQEFFRKPDKKITLKAWMQKALNDILDLDALAIYKHPNRGGGLYALELIDGATIKPLIDERGLPPDPPYPAFQQFVYGLPGALMTADQMIYRKETERTDSAYGLSRVEFIIMRVNQALRKQNKDLSTFTDGNTPSGFMEVPDDGSQWTPEELALYQAAWDSVMAGNDSIRSRLKMLLPGWKYVKSDAEKMYDILVPFDMFLLNITVAAFGLTMAELGFTENVNKSSGDTQEGVIYRRTMAPVMNLFAEIFTDVLRTDFKDDRFIACWKGYEEPEDFKAKAEAWDILVKDGIQSTSQAARGMGLEPLIETTPMVVVPGQGITWVEDQADPKLRQAKKDAMLAGLQLAKDNPGAAKANGEPAKNPPEQSEGEEEKAEAEESGPQAKQQPKEKPVKRAAQPEQHTGMMVAFLLDPETAQQLALPDGEPWYDLHVTLAYLGNMEETPFGTLNPATTVPHISAALKSYAQSAQQLTGKVGGIGRFINEGQDQTPVYASVNVAGLQHFRNDLVRTLEQAGYGVAKNFEYTPHITLAYIDPDQDMPVESVPLLPLTFSELCLAIGDQLYRFPLGSSPAQASLMESSEPMKPQGVDRVLAEELRRWRTRAMDDIKRGRAFRGFTTTIIPEAIHQGISRRLGFCTSVEELRGIFERAKYSDNDVGAWQLVDNEINGQIQKLRDQGFTHARWKAHAAACPSCLENDGKIVRLGQQFPSGALFTPNHNHCACDCECLIEPLRLEN